MRFQKDLKRLSFYLVTGAVVIGIMVLLGWQFQIDFLKRIIPGLVAMNPATAICFILIGFSFFIYFKNPTDAMTRLTLRTVAVLVSCVGLSCMLTNIMGIEYGVDHLLFADQLKTETINSHNRMAPNTAFNFIITGISLFLLTTQSLHNYKTAQNLALVTSTISLLSIVGYIYGVRSFYGILKYIPMAIHTSFCFLLTSSSILFQSCDKGFMVNYTSNYVGSTLARKLIPYVVIGPVVLGFIIIAGEKSGLYVTHFGTALFTAIQIIILTYLIKKIQASVNKADLARSAAEQALMEINNQLEERTISLGVLNKELESFSYSISHDLKAPLRTIQGYAKMLQKNYAHKLDEDGNQTTETIIHNSAKMSQLIDNLLDFSVIRTKEIQFDNCNMKQIVTNVINHYCSNPINTALQININHLPDCSGDPKMIEQVWVNLISNAVKYSAKKENPIIEIGAYRKDFEQIYYIKDNGEGFDMSYSHKLFIVFQRLHSVIEFEGTGVGLAIAHRIITRHAGKIWAEGKKGEGACFYFSIPDVKKNVPSLQAT
ncbi:MAG: ATP-binding protein [Bacteroidota bacterium]